MRGGVVCAALWLCVNGGCAGSATDRLPHTTSSRTAGGALVVTRDGETIVAVNRAAGSVAVLDVDPRRLPLTAMFGHVDLADDSDAAPPEPWSAVIGADDDTAYVILRERQRLVRIRNLRSNPALDPVSAPTGSEPTGLAITPSGRELWVANWGEGTLTVIDAETLDHLATIDLNAALVATGKLGTVESRPALAHPRAIAITDDGDEDDADETAYVTEFYGQARDRAALPADERALIDVARVGLVYPIAVQNRAVGMPIELAPVVDTGFTDHKGEPTGCFPNQLASATLHGNELFVSATCASPRGPIGPEGPAADGTPPKVPECGEGADVPNARALVHAVIFSIDTTTGREIPDRRVVLTRAHQELYEQSGTLESERAMPLGPIEIAFVPGTGEAIVAAYGSDALFRVDYAAHPPVVGFETRPFIDLDPELELARGKLPIGLLLVGTPEPGHALVLHENTRSLQEVDLDAGRVVNVTDTATRAADTSANNGRWLFSTGRQAWSWRGQRWSSCNACHVDGLSDGVTWYFPRGPRQTIPLDGTYEKGVDSPTRRIMNWTAIFDEVHDFEVVIRRLSGGAGAIAWRRPASGTSCEDRIAFDGAAPVGEQKPSVVRADNLNGSSAALVSEGAQGCAADATTCDVSANLDWNDVDAYLRAVRSPRAPVGLDAGEVAAGAIAFYDGRCAACHGGAQWTLSRMFYTPGIENNGDGTDANPGRLRQVTYMLPVGFPPALSPAAQPDPTNAAMRVAPLRYAGPEPAKLDQIQCVLRAVGTFPAADVEAAVATLDGPELLEVRADMSARAQGETGFNPPSLLGAASSAPYFHAGNARTLEETLEATFAPHHQAHAPGFLTDDATRAPIIRSLVAYLLSIDGNATPRAIPLDELGFDPDLCANASAPLQ